MVLLHGYTETSHMWLPIMPLLAKRHTVIVPDLRGAGGSAKPESGYDPHVPDAWRLNGRVRRGPQPTSTVLGVRVALTLGTLARSAVAFARGNKGLAAEHRAYVRGLWTGAPDMT